MRYCVLYIQGSEQHKAKGIIERHMPEGMGEVFIPRMELYLRGKREYKEVSIFPGYVFLYTSLNMKEVHDILKVCRAELNSAMKELALRERQMGDPDFLYEEAVDDAVYEASDLSDEETEFLDMLREGNGLLSMSYGYQEDKKTIVMEGPLKAFENSIDHLDKHNRKAFLKLEINGRPIRAGFECKPKTYWFPKEDSKIVRLSDGTEVDLGELSRRAMSI